MVTFDSVLNAVIPWAVGIVGIYILYKPLKEPLAPLFTGIGNFAKSLKRKINKEDDDSLLEEIQTLEYE